MGQLVKVNIEWNMAEHGPGYQYNTRFKHEMFSQFMGKNSMRTINSVINLQWANYDRTAIDMEVDFDELDEEYVQFTATPNDREDHGVELYNRAIAGDFGAIAEFPVPDNITGEEALNLARKRRTNFLVQTDYIEMPTKWATLTTEEQTAWANYRNALRDLPENYPNLELHWNENYTDLTTWVNVIWPTEPE